MKHKTLEAMVATAIIALSVLIAWVIYVVYS